MTTQWKDKLRSKFGLAFTIRSRARRGDSANKGLTSDPWSTGSRFIISHNLLADETYAAGLRDVLGEFRPAHCSSWTKRIMPRSAGGSRYAISSHSPRPSRSRGAVRATPLCSCPPPHATVIPIHSRPCWMLDPQRFARRRGAPKRLGPVMVRRLQVRSAPAGPSLSGPKIETDHSGRSARRHAGIAPRPAWRIWCPPHEADFGAAAHKAALANSPFVGLQQRLLSSVAAFARTLKVHRRPQKLLDNELCGQRNGQRGIHGFGLAGRLGRLDLEDATAEQVLEADDDAAAEAASVAGAEGATRDALRAEAHQWSTPCSPSPNRPHPAGCPRALAGAVDRANMLAGRSWNDRRLILFTNTRIPAGGWSAACARRSATPIAPTGASTSSPATGADRRGPSSARSIPIRRTSPCAS